MIECSCNKTNEMLPLFETEKSKHRGLVRTGSKGSAEPVDFFCSIVVEPVDFHR